MSTQRLLFVSPRFLFPADSGGKIRTRDILRGLLGRRFEITLASPVSAAAAMRHAADLRNVCDRFVGWPEAPRLGRSARRFLAVLSPLPIAVATDHSKAGRNIVAAELMRQPEVVVADFPHAAVLFPDECPIPSVLFTHNVEAEIFRRHANVAASAALRSLWRSQARKMKRFEDHAAHRFDGVIAVSERDADYFKAICGSDRVHSIPTGVDLDYFTFSTPCRDVAPDAGTMVFTGSMDWRANVDGIRFFMDAVWPLIVAARPKARMVVVGHSPPADLRRAAAERNLSWSFTGFVDDVRVHVNAADLYVIPLRVGGGTRIKAFEAMAMGCPIASTSIGVEGLPVDAGIHCVIGDSAEALARTILHLLDDSAERAAIAQRARALVEKKYSHQLAALAFEEACLRTIVSKRRTVMRPDTRSTAVPTADVLR